MSDAPIHHLLRLLDGVKPAGKDRWVARCPAHEDRDPSLSIGLRDGKVLLHCFAGCEPARVLQALGISWSNLLPCGRRDMAEFGSRMAFNRPAPQDEPLDTRKVQDWERWWCQARTDHQLLRTYIKARGLSLPVPDTLRLAVWNSGPVMLARVIGPDGALRGLHRTFLAPDGSKRLERKLACGSRRNGSAIRLYETVQGECLALTEGIETALAIRQVLGWPVWACISAGGLSRVQLPPEVREVHICADHDDAGIKAADELMSRLLHEGRTVSKSVPPVYGNDWLDALLSEVRS